MSYYADNIKAIELQLENCETITVARENIGDFFMGKFKRQIAKFGSNYIGDATFVDEISMELHANANTLDAFTMTCSSNTTLPFDRLAKYGDITHVVIIRDNGHQEPLIRETFTTNYGEDNEDEYTINMENEHQKCKQNQFGDLYIVIGKGLDIDKIYPDSDINNKDERDFKWWRSRETEDC